MAIEFTQESVRRDLETLYAALEESFDFGEPLPDAGAKNTAPGSSGDWLTLAPGLYGQYRADTTLPAREPNYVLLGSGAVSFSLDPKAEMNEIHQKRWDLKTEVNEPNFLEFYLPGEAAGLEGAVYSEFSGKSLSGVPGTAVPLGKKADHGRQKYPSFFFGGEFVLSLGIEKDRIMVSFEKQGGDTYLHPSALPKEAVYEIADRLAGAYQKSAKK